MYVIVCVNILRQLLLGATMGWFVGMAFLPLLYKHSEYLTEHNWLPYVILCAFALAGGILIICMQKVHVLIDRVYNYIIIHQIFFLARDLSKHNSLGAANILGNI